MYTVTLYTHHFDISSNDSNQRKQKRKKKNGCCSSREKKNGRNFGFAFYVNEFKQKFRRKIFFIFRAFGISLFIFRICLSGEICSLFITWIRHLNNSIPDVGWTFFILFWLILVSFYFSRFHSSISQETQWWRRKLFFFSSFCRHNFHFVLHTQHLRNRATVFVFVKIFVLFSFVLSPGKCLENALRSCVTNRKNCRI